MDFRVELIGGPFDGSTDIYLLNRELPPDRIIVFTCKDGEWCGGRAHPCRLGNGRAHTWIAEKDEPRPPRSVPYGLRSWSEEPDDEGNGEAVYGRGEVRPVGRAQREDSVPEADDGEFARPSPLIHALAWPWERASWEPFFAGLSYDRA